jgi:DNA-binding protein YbaB
MNLVDYEQIADEVETIQRKLADIRVTADSDDGLITATVDACGELIELTLDPRIYRAPDSHKLSAAIAETIQRAVRQAQGEVFILVRPFLPPGATPATTDLDLDPFLTALGCGTGRGVQRTTAWR